MVPILEIWFTPSGAAVTFLLVFLIVLLCAFFSTKAQRLVFQLLAKGVRGKWRGGEFELGTPVPSKSMDEFPSGEAAPAPQDDAESPGFRTSVAPTKELEVHAEDDENTLRTKMIIASFSLDQEALDNAYKALISLPGRKESDESLTTDKLSLEHRMGDESAAGKLARLAEDNPAWYEPRQSLASIYYSLGSYDKASAYLAEAKKTAQDDDQRIRSLLLDARIREKTEGPAAAIHFLKEVVAHFALQHNQAKIWKRVAELHWNCGEKIPSFITAEIALQMDPLDKDLRFQLAYRYADGESTKPLAYYHYDKLRDQDARYPSCLNNMALVLEELDMPAASVDILKQAKGFDQPYPHGNLAISLAKAGFLDEARAMIEELPEHRRLETRAAEAVDFIRRKQSAEAKNMEQLERSSEMLHSVYVRAAATLEKGEVLETTDVVGRWMSKLWELSLEKDSTDYGLVGTLRRAESKYDVRLSLKDNLISGEATDKGGALGLLSVRITYQILLAGERERKMIGLIYTDEMDPTQVTLVRQD